MPPDIQQAEKEDEPGAQLRGGNIVHTMVAVAQVEDLREAERSDYLGCVALIGEDGFAEREIEGILFIIAGANEISGGSFAKQFGDGAAGEDRAVIQMRRNQSQHFSFARSTGTCALESYIRSGCLRG